jgi:hypothetical protein
METLTQAEESQADKVIKSMVIFFFLISIESMVIGSKKPET